MTRSHDNARHIALPSAREDANRAKQRVDTPQTRAPTYKLAFADGDFLLRDELRPVRLQLELLKPELELQAQGINSTIVVFGSARIQPPAEARARREAAELQAQAAPEDAVRRAALARARQAEALAHNYDLARDFARLVSTPRDADGRQRFVIVTGGGPGIMQAANEGASLAGGVSIGHNIVLPHEQAPNPFITPELCFQFHYFSMRKMHLLTRARALVAFPGGFGTMDELFETLCLIQTGKARSLPVLLFDRAYWTKVIDFAAMAEYGMVDSADLSIFRFVESAEEAWEIIDAHHAESQA